MQEMRSGLRASMPNMPLFCCMEMAQEGPDGEPVLPLFMNAADAKEAMAQATAVRRRWEEMEKDADGEEVEPAVAESAASLSGMSPEEVDFAAALSKFKPSTAGLSGVVRA